jgi:hypothetical protein
MYWIGIGLAIIGAIALMIGTSIYKKTRLVFWIGATLFIAGMYLATKAVA